MCQDHQGSTGDVLTGEGESRGGRYEMFREGNSKSSVKWEEWEWQLIVVLRISIIFKTRESSGFNRHLHRSLK